MTTRWYIEFTDADGEKTVEPARCSFACEYPNTREGALKFASLSVNNTDLEPPRIFSEEIVTLWDELMGS